MKCRRLQNNEMLYADETHSLLEQPSTKYPHYLKLEKFNVLISIKCLA